MRHKGFMTTRKILFSVILLFATIPTMGKDNTKEYVKILNEFDLDSNVRKVKDRGSFWFIVWFNNENLADFAEALQKEKSSAQAAAENIGKCAYMSEPYYSSLKIVNDSTALDFAAMLYEDLGAKEVEGNAVIRIVKDDEPNAYALPDGRLFINSGLIRLDSLTYEGLLGVCAHEMAHYVLKHAATRFYKMEKKAKKNKILAGITAGVNVAAAGYAASQGVDTDWDKVNETITDLAKWAFENTEKYRYKYSREQELEADIVAYRFLECMGYGGENYIKVLESLQSKYSMLEHTTTNSDHPSTSFRIGLLKYMAAHPEFKREPPKKTFENIKK